MYRKWKSRVNFAWNCSWRPNTWILERTTLEHGQVNDGPMLQVAWTSKHIKLAAKQVSSAGKHFNSGLGRTFIEDWSTRSSALLGKSNEVGWHLRSLDSSHVDDRMRKDLKEQLIQWTFEAALGFNGAMNTAIHIDLQS
jgi:hypothetical protein